MLSVYVALLAAEAAGPGDGHTDREPG
jgi:hypothetical protein